MNRNSSGRRYDREFKNNAVALVRGGAQSPRWPEIWASLNGSLGHWARRAEEGQTLSEPK